MTEVVSKVSVQNGTHVEIELEDGRKWIVTAYRNGGVQLTTISKVKDQQGGSPIEVERLIGPKLVMMPYHANSIDGLADELTDGGTFGVELKIDIVAPTASLLCSVSATLN